ncbi:hypothetical protein [uncultured Leifsonia sp.]|uniref:hypothetical protein n=1 Tax=uncultured Leifsonia sp. TaxID=340359 RepID=UPI0028D00B1F|nr:hypothetical protein [uncultured Leifsonia sp.]
MCGAPLERERRLMPTVGGAWAVVTVALRCVNPLCRRSTTAAPPGRRPLVA